MNGGNFYLQEAPGAEVGGQKTWEEEREELRGSIDLLQVGSFASIFARAPFIVEVGGERRCAALSKVWHTRHAFVSEP